MKRCLKIRRSHFLLLEILIAFGLVALCIFPLVFSQVKILMSEKELNHRLIERRKANILFTEIVEKLYQKAIPLVEQQIALEGGFTAQFILKKEKGKEYFLYQVILKSKNKEFNYHLFCKKTNSSSL